MLAVGAALAGVPAAAMIPLHVQRQSELRAILNLPGIAAELGEPIERIVRISPGVWRIGGTRCHIDVRIEAARPAAPGRTPPGFVPRPGRRVCGR